MEAQRSALKNMKEAKDFDAILQTLKSGHVGVHVMRNASIVAQGMHPSSALPMGRSVESAARTATSRLSAGHCRDNRQDNITRC